MEQRYSVSFYEQPILPGGSRTLCVLSLWIDPSNSCSHGHMIIGASLLLEALCSVLGFKYCELASVDKVDA